MFVSLLLALAPAPAAVPEIAPEPQQMRIIREPMVAGPTPLEFRTLSQPHPNSDDRMFPDIAIGAMNIDGDTLYVELTNKGRSATQTPTLVAARAVSGAMRSDLVEVKTGRLAAGESRWVPVKGFSVKTASTSGTVFALANATVVSAAARLLPSSVGALDRTGQGCGECTTEMSEDNNQLTLRGSAIGHGAPR